jgi:hypothetical protein
MLKILDTNTTKVDLKLIRAMFAECPSLNKFYISNNLMAGVRKYVDDKEAFGHVDFFVNADDPVWHSDIMVLPELEMANIFVGTSESGDTVVAVIRGEV